MKIGDRVLDTYTRRVGVVLAVDDAVHRCTIRFSEPTAHSVTGCMSWFVPVEEEVAFGHEG